MKSKRTRALLAGPALAIALVACGGGDNEVATTTTAPATTATAATTTAPAAAIEEPAAPAAAQATASPAPTATTSVAEAEPGDNPTPVQATVAPLPTEPPAPAVERLSADVAIANAAANIDNLAAATNATNVLDIEVLAVGDGSIQTLRNVVEGDRPVLLWFFSPH